jgi:hypothetical protein
MVSFGLAAGRAAAGFIESDDSDSPARIVEEAADTLSNFLLETTVDSIFVLGVSVLRRHLEELKRWNAGNAFDLLRSKPADMFLVF